MKQLLKKTVAWILAQEAKGVLKKYNPKIVGVTGSVGKTSTKEAIYSVLAATHSLRKSEKSFNSELGVPLTILGRESGWNDPFKWLATLVHGFVLTIQKTNYPEMLVLEVGADRPGDIKSLTKWLKPHIAVITGVPDIPVHVEYFESAEAVAAEKKELAKALRSEGSLILNGDDDRVWEMRSEFRSVAHTYGFDKRNDVIASHMETIYDPQEGGAPIGTRFRVNYSGGSVPVVINGGVGKTHVYPVLAACAVGLQAGMNMVSIGEALRAYKPIAGRMRLLEGAAGSTLIDDTYNASPIATMAALETLREVKTKGRKIAVLADMLELGKHSIEAHRALGVAVASVADMLVVVGIRARGIAQAAIEAGLPKERVREYEQGESEVVGRDLLPVLLPGDIVLVKGSQSMRMEKTVKELLADKSKAKELLVRQDTAWENR